MIDYSNELEEFPEWMVRKKNLEEYEKKVSQEFKTRKEKRRLSEALLAKERKIAILEPYIKNNKIVWSDKYNNGSFYEGYLKKEKCFEIKRGVVTFSLKVIHKEILCEKKSFSSINILKLQKEASEILNKNIDFLRKFKAIS